MEEFETILTFLGTGTSQGVPIIGCQCAVCRSEDSRDKRLRSSVLIEAKGIRVVIDTGPDFRQQMLREHITEIDAILYTHEHIDHIGGMDDIRAFNYVMSREVDIYCEPRVEQSLRRMFDYAFAEPKYPGVPEVRIHPIGSDKRSFRVRGLEIMPVRGFHYKLPVLGFRIGEIAYLTDMNHIEDAEIEKIRGVSILVINALRRDEHISHFSLKQALEVIRQVGPKEAYLTHISHQLGRHGEMEKELESVKPTRVRLAYDGLKIKA